MRRRRATRIDSLRSFQAAPEGSLVYLGGRVEACREAPTERTIYTEQVYACETGGDRIPSVAAVGAVAIDAMPFDLVMGNGDRLRVWPDLNSRAAGIDRVRTRGPDLNIEIEPKGKAWLKFRRISACTISHGDLIEVLGVKRAGFDADAERLAREAPLGWGIGGTEARPLVLMPGKAGILKT
ncbi:MAG: hypothetical protein HY698_14860 [Deltaproteobacteria bacterium]|nr:hypothetical protein [Deltaproteobacteria bacterium]